MSNKQLYDILQECPDKKIDDKLLFLEKKITQITKCPVSELETLKHTLSHFKSEFKRKWVTANYKHDRFIRFKFALWTIEKLGRPSKDFGESSDRSKRRKTKDLRDTVATDELTYAAQMSQRAGGNKDASKIIKEITLTPTRATKFRKVISSNNQIKIKKHSPSEALAIFVEGDFSRRQWEILHSANKNIYPCYSLIKKSKNRLLSRRTVNESYRDLCGSSLTRFTQPHMFAVV